MQPGGQTFGSAPEPPAPELAAEYQIQQRRVVLDADYRIDYVWWELRDRNAGRQAPSPLRAVGLLLDRGLLQRHYLYLSRAGTRTHCVLALPAWPRPATCRRSRAPYRPKSARYLPAPAQ